MRVTNNFQIKLSVYLICILFFLTQIHAEETPNYKIGGAFALSGFGASWGTAERNGAMLAIEHFNKQGGINNTPVSLIIEDTLCTNVGTVTAVTKLISSDGVPIIIGPSWLDSFGGATPIAEKNKVILITPSGSSSAINPTKNFNYIFSTWFPVDKEARTLLNHFKDKGIKKLSLLLGDDPFWELFRKVFKEEAKSQNVEILTDHRINGTLKDFKTIILKLKKEKPSAIFFGLNDEASFQTFLKQKTEISLTTSLQNILKTLKIMLSFDLT